MDNLVQQYYYLDDISVIPVYNTADNIKFSGSNYPNQQYYYYDIDIGKKIFFESDLYKTYVDDYYNNIYDIIANNLKKKSIGIISEDEIKID
jgi:hypothetical protein